MADVKALGLVSGGLDSILAALLLRKAGVEVTGLCLETPFFDAQKAEEAAQRYSFPLTVLEVGEEHLQQVVKNPRYGYGSNMNPCIDCHAYMLRKAGQILETENYDFLFTGEVLGQRPMSQNANALKAVAKASTYGHLVLRPLSAGCLAPTIMEKQGLVDRAKLADISGRGRKRQMELAKELGVEHYPAPGGGCLLTDPGFSRRLRDLLDFQPDCNKNDVELLKHGRHFRLSAQAKLIVGRNQVDNIALAQIAAKSTGWLELNMAQGPGPLGIFIGCPEQIGLACSLFAAYGPPQDGESKVRVGQQVINTQPASKRHAQEYIL